MLLVRRHWLTVAIAASVIALALSSGGYGIPARTVVGGAAWWTVIMASVLALWPRPPRAALVSTAAFAVLAVLTGLSAFWAASAERALLEFDRVGIYLGILAVTFLVTRREDAVRCADGLGLGIVGVAVLALGSRCLPDVVSGGQLAKLLPSAVNRLSYPVEYWNGLGILVGIGVPLLLGASVRLRSNWARGVALAPLPAITATIYLTSSRGGAAVAIVGMVAFVVLAGRRVAAGQAALAAIAGGAGAIAVLRARPDLVDGPLGSAAAISQGKSAAALLIGVCALTGLAHGLLSATRLRDVRMRPIVARGLLGAALLLAVVGTAVADPAERLDQFKRPPGEFTRPAPDLVRAHLLSGGGSGRWQFWSSALDELGDRPVAGRGAGSFEAWWAQHGSIYYFIRNAHSLYLETLGDLGLAGGALLLVGLGAGLVAGARRLRAREDDQRTAIATLLAAFVAFLVGAGVDWVWQLTVVGAIGVVCLGLLTGPATASTADPAPAARRRRPAVGSIALVLASCCVLGLLALPWLVQLEVRASEAAGRGGDIAKARKRALAARRLEPWASSPRLQLALIREREGNLADARREIAGTIRRDPRDWRIRIVAARLATEAGDIPDARRRLAQARALNPRSPLFQGGVATSRSP